MFKISSVSATIIALFLIAQPAMADISKTQTFENRIVVKQTINGTEKTTCPNGGKSCVVTVTLDEETGGFSSTVTEASIIPAPTDPTFPLDPTGYTEDTDDLDLILNRISDDLLSGEGVPVLP